MRVLLAGGGTAGHINPALAIAKTIKEKEPKAEILFVGNKTGLEQRLVKNAGFDIKSISISGFKRSLSPSALVHNVKTAFRAVSASSASSKIIKEFKPDICIGTGGYVSGPVMRAAQKLNIPVIVHEQNAYPGVTTKMLSKKAEYVMLAVDEARKHFDGSPDFVLTGNPIRPEILRVDEKAAKAKLNKEQKPLVLSFGGSLGARKINEGVADLIARSGKDGKYNHIHAYGQYGLWFPDLLREKGTDPDKCENLDIREYIDNMAECMAAADVVICRAGAITLSEVQALGKPSVLIPSPNVAENHQYHNAMALVNNNAAVVIEEKDLSEKSITEAVDKLLSDKDALKSFSDNARKMAITDANERIWNVIEKVLKK